MAYNALYGYDTGLYGYGPANGFASADGVVQPLQRSYPAWMQDINARGIGDDSSNDQAIPAFIPLNSGPLTNPTTAADVAPASQTASAPQLMQSLNGGAESGAGGGSAEQLAANGGVGGPSGVNLGPAPGNLGDLFGLGPSVADIAAINVGGLQAGDITGGTGGAPTDPNANNGGLSPGGMDLGVAAANGGMADITDGGANSGGNAGGGNSDTSAGGAQGGGDVGSSSEIVGHAKGGIIGRNALMGPNPRGPDDGWGKLEVGEGVLTDKALKHYGKGIVARLNRLEVPKARLRA